MIVDSSALTAVLIGAPDADIFVEAIARQEAPALSAASHVEIAVVVDARRDPALGRAFGRFLEDSRIAVEAVTPRQAEIAREACQDFGRGAGHPARPSFGDGFAYALARDKNQPLLFKGDEFRHTDVEPAAGAKKDVYK
ncbi:MAG: type II toxin-antitoxin system VapC family toxin [Parvularculaceae bacterium]